MSMTLRMLTHYDATITLRAHGDMRECSDNLGCSPIARTTVTYALIVNISSPGSAMAMVPAESGVQERRNARTPGRLGAGGSNVRTPERLAGHNCGR